MCIGTVICNLKVYRISTECHTMHILVVTNNFSFRVVVLVLNVRLCFYRLSKLGNGMSMPCFEKYISIGCAISDTSDLFNSVVLFLPNRAI